MYPTSGVTIRGDINVKVEEAARADEKFIGLKVMPPVSVPTKSGTYPRLRIKSGELLTMASTVRAPGGTYGEMTRSWENDTYDTIDRGLEEFMDDVQKKDLARFFNLEAATARFVLRAMMLDHENRVAGQIFSTTNFGAAVNSGVAYTEANLATISFVKDTQDAVARLKAAGSGADTIVISEDVYNRVRRSIPVIQWVAGSLRASSDVDSDTLALAFKDYGIKQVLVAKARYNAAKKGATISLQPIWSNSYIWVGSVNIGATMVEDALTGGAGFTLVWNEEGGTFVTEMYRDDKRRGNYVRVRQHTVEKVVDPTSGTLIGTQYA